MKTYNVHLNRVASRVFAGAADVLIQAGDLADHAGDAGSTVAYLKALGIGRSVEIRTEGWIRSCMNKPALWTDIMADQLAYEAKQARRVGMIG